MWYKQLLLVALLGFVCGDEREGASSGYPTANMPPSAPSFGQAPGTGMMPGQAPGSMSRAFPSSGGMPSGMGGMPSGGHGFPGAMGHGANQRPPQFDFDKAIRILQMAKQFAHAMQDQSGRQGGHFGGAGGFGGGQMQMHGMGRGGGGGGGGWNGGGGQMQMHSQFPRHPHMPGGGGGMSHGSGLTPPAPYPMSTFSEVTTVPYPSPPAPYGGSSDPTSGDVRMYPPTGSPMADKMRAG